MERDSTRVMVAPRFASESVGYMTKSYRKPCAFGPREYPTVSPLGDCAMLLVDATRCYESGGFARGFSTLTFLSE
jgi:hypothetical protein